MDKELLAAIGEMLDKKFDEKLEPVKQDVTGLKQDMTGVRQDITGLKQDMTGVRQDITGLKQDMTGVRQDITGLKQDMAGLDQKVANLQQDMANVKQTVTCLDQKATELQKQNDLIVSGVIKIKDEVRVRGDAYFDIKSEVIGLRKSQERVEVVLDRVDAMTKVVQKAHQDHEDHEARIRALEGRVTA